MSRQGRNRGRRGWKKGGKRVRGGQRKRGNTRETKRKGGLFTELKGEGAGGRRQ